MIAFRFSKRICVFAVVVLFSVAPSLDADTYPDLVRRLTNLDWLAEAPPVGERTEMASSYDRNSQYDAVKDKYIRWGANGDGDGFVRMEGNLTVLADIQGPGCLVRQWSAKALEGHVRIYLDGAATAAVDLPFRAYFDGSTKPFNRASLVYKTTKGKQAGGLNNFTPIPFQKSCKIVADPSWGEYFQFDYTRFPAGTVLPTFHLDLSPQDAAALDQADQILSQCGKNPAPARSGEKTDQVTVQAAAGATTSVAQLTGAQAVTALRVKLDLPADAEAARVLLRQLAIQITWDGDKSPSVWCPLGDFFASFGGAKPFQSLPLGLMSDGTFYSYWYMPFAKKAKIEVINDSPTAVPMQWEVSHAPLTQPIAGLNRFHAKWHRDAFAPEREDRQPDWTLLTTQGSGRYVGTQLHVWNPRGSWWGEGDDKFFVDGEKFPSLFGTGSEDYFGAAWGLALFDRPFHGLVDADPTSAHWVVHRWHIADSVPFQSSFEADIEKSFPNDRPTLYDAVAYWYLNAQGTDPYPVIPVADRIGYWPAPPVRHEPGAIEGEDLVIVKQEPENSTRHHPAAGDSIVPNVVSGDLYLSWEPLELNQRLEVQLPVASTGKYQLLLDFMHMRRGGIFQVRLDGKALGAPVDIYQAQAGVQAVFPADSVDLGVVNLTPGNHVLSFEWVGLNEAGDKNRKGALFGLDFVKLVPAP